MLAATTVVLVGAAPVSSGATPLQPAVFPVLTGSVGAARTGATLLLVSALVATAAAAEVWRRRTR